MSERARQPCGTRASFVRGCRCDRCRTANADYHRDWRIGVPTTPAATVDKLRQVTPPGRWVNHAACAGLPPDWFFPDIHDVAPAEVKAVCATCEVRIRCLDWAVRNRIDEGWWGGVSPQDRRRIRREQRLADEPAAEAS